MDQDADAAGRVLDDRYELREVIGRGGAGVVHRAWDRLRRREVAVKLLPPGSSRLSDRGREEAAVLEGLDHPDLVALHDVVVLDGRAALVMELVDGPSLQVRLESGPLAPAEAATVLRDVASALSHAHRRGVVHRDVKPGNVLLRLQDGEVAQALLSDFGIARLADATRTTQEGTVVGTLRYLSPEQARGERVAAASDVYSLGLTLLVALTGEEAFPGGDAESLAGRLLRAPALPPGLPADWSDLMRGMTAPEPEHRYDASSVAALAAVLGTGSARVDPRDTVPMARRAPIRAGSGLVARPVRPRRRQRLTTAAASVAVLGGALGAVLAVAAAPAPTGERDAVAAAEPIVSRAPAPSASPARPAASPPAPAIPAAAPAAAERALSGSGEVTAPGPVEDDASGDDHGGRSGRSTDDRSGRGSGSGSSAHGSGHGSDD